MNDISRTYSYECGPDGKYRVVERNAGEVVASIDAHSGAQELEIALKGWVLSPNLRKTVEGWLKVQHRPSAAKKPKRQSSTRGSKVTVTRLQETSMP